MKRFVSSKRFEAATAAGVLFLALASGCAAEAPQQSPDKISLAFDPNIHGVLPHRRQRRGLVHHRETEIWWAEENCTAAQITTIIFLLSETRPSYNPFD